MAPEILVALIVSFPATLAVVVNIWLSLRSLRVSQANAAALVKVKEQTNGMMAHLEKSATALGTAEGHAAGMVQGRKDATDEEAARK